MADILPQADDISLDLLSQLLQFNPNKRPTAEQCLEHIYLSKYMRERECVWERERDQRMMYYLLYTSKST